MVSRTKSIRSSFQANVSNPNKPHGKYMWLYITSYSSICLLYEFEILFFQSWSTGTWRHQNTEGTAGSGFHSDVFVAVWAIKQTDKSEIWVKPVEWNRKDCQQLVTQPSWNTGAVKTFELKMERDTGSNKGSQQENKPYADVLQGSGLVSPARMEAILDFPSAIFNQWSVREGQPQGLILEKSKQTSQLYVQGWI